MITICSKFGIRGFCVAVDIGISEGVDVSVAAAGTGVEGGVAEESGMAV